MVGLFQSQQQQQQNRPTIDDDNNNWKKKYFRFVKKSFFSTLTSTSTHTDTGFSLCSRKTTTKSKRNSLSKYRKQQQPASQPNEKQDKEASSSLCFSSFIYFFFRFLFPPNFFSVHGWIELRTKCFFFVKFWPPPWSFFFVCLFVCHMRIHSFQIFFGMNEWMKREREREKIFLFSFFLEKNPASTMKQQLVIV